MFDEALKDYEQAIQISPLNPKYLHAKGITYEALAGGIDVKYGRRRRFDLEENTMSENSDSLQVYLRKDFLEYSEMAIKMYLAVLDIDEKFT